MDWRDYVTTRSESEPIGSFELPESGGTAPLPQAIMLTRQSLTGMRSNIRVLTLPSECAPANTDSILKFLQGKRGEWASAKRKLSLIRNPENALLIANSKIGADRRRRVQVITYDEHGNIRYGFHY